MNTLSVVIITQNEQRNIGRCLESVKGVADQIVVVDSGSTDDTESVVRSFGADFVHHDWEGYAQQKNFAESLATGDFILSIDADEALSDELKSSVAKLKNEGFGQNEVYEVKRLTNFCGDWIHHCGWYPDAKIRIYARGTSRWDGLVHESLIFSNNPKVVPLRGDLLHYSYYSVAEFISRQDHYSTLAAQKDQGKKVSIAKLVFKPMWKFLRDYLFRLGFLDGKSGYIICRTNAYYTFMKYAKRGD